MVFYNNRVSIGDVNGEEIYLIRNVKEKLILNYYSVEGDTEELLIADNVLGEFDILIKGSSLYLIYQDKNYNLNLAIIRGKFKEIHKLSTVDFPKVLELNIISHDDCISMIFLYPLENKRNVFQIEHHMLKGDKWYNYLVDQVRVSQVLNPMKLINRGRSLYLAYYYDNQICLKLFDGEDAQWTESIVLTDNKEKLYLDMIYDNDYLHLTYAEAVDGNYLIKYKRFSYDVSFFEEFKIEISRKSNTSNPTIIKNDNRLWIVWNESSRIYSRYSSDNGLKWSEIMAWDEAINNSIVRYKYTTNLEHESRLIHNSFGTIYPDIRFIGFE